MVWLLADKPIRAQEIIQTLGIPGMRGYIWLQLLEQIGVLENGPDGYSLSNPAREAILESRSRLSWQHLAQDERERSAGVHNLALYIREPGSVWAAQGLFEQRNYVDKMKLDPQRAREFTRMLYELHQYLGNELAALLDLTGVHRLMDVGGGSGVVSMALLRKYPDLTATVLDIENVCTAGREIAAEASLSDRISYCPVDFKHEELLGGFDMILQCDVSVFDQGLYRRMYASLNPGGRLVMANNFPTADNMAPAKTLVWRFLDSLEDPNIAYPTVAQTRAEWAKAGFHAFPGEHTLSDNRIVIQAQK
jgi:predicted O-methyltransferase YrrM